MVALEEIGDLGGLCPFELLLSSLELLALEFEGLLLCVVGLPGGGASHRRDDEGQKRDSGSRPVCQAAGNLPVNQVPVNHGEHSTESKLYCNLGGMCYNNHIVCHTQ